MPVTRVLYAKQWYTENRLTREQCPPVNSLYHAAFQNILEFRIIPFSMIQEISGCSSVLTADFSEINGFSSITTQENRDYITIIHHSIEGFFILCNIWDLLIYSFVFKILLNTASYSFAILSTLKLFTTY